MIRDDFITFDRITKRFAGVVALENVSLSIARGECHGLMGENGAGKSTLGKVLAGIHRPDEGRIVLDGQEVSLRSPAEARRAGIGMVHQELAFCPDLSIAENLSMGVYPTRGGLFLNRHAMAKRATALLGRIGARLDVHQTMRRLSTAQEQLVQIASAVGTGARVLIFDEPTSSLSEPESQQLFSLIEQLRKDGVTIIYVSHRMPEVFRLCDRFSVLRDGRFVGTLERGATEDDAVRMMIGRPVAAYFPRHGKTAPAASDANDAGGAATRTAGETVHVPADSQTSRRGGFSRRSASERRLKPPLPQSVPPEGDVMLRVRGLSSPGKFKDVSFEVRRSEIVGFAGLVGSGRSEIAQALFGLDRAATGHVEMDGRPMPLGSVRRSMRWGMGLAPEDRKRQGLVLSMSGRANFSLALLDRLTRFGFIDKRTERRQTRDYFEKLAVKTPSIESPVGGLSGGNQQKVVLARWLARDAKLLIVDEPTRGVDVGAKAVIHELLDDLAHSGVAILLISSELPEVIHLSTRLLVLREGQITGQLPREQANADAVLRLMAGVGGESNLLHGSRA